MKCEKCGGEWIPPKGLSVSLANCPFCCTPLLNTETAGGYTEMSAFLEYLISLYGSELYKDIRKLNNLISDLYRGDERMKRAYRCAMLDDMLSLKVYELSLKPINERMAFYDKLTSNFAEVNFYSQEFGKQIVDSFVKGLKLEILLLVSTKATEEDGEWIDEFGVKYSTDRKKLIRGNKKLTSYNIKEGTVVICDGAFSDYWNLKSITIPSSITSIGDFAFHYCKSLESITIPSSVISIGKIAFEGCSKLHLKIENNPYYYVEDDILYSKKTNTLLWCPEYIKEVIISSSIVNIGDFAFRFCRALESITIPSSVTSIGEQAFSWCKSLESINIPSSVMSIGKGTFYRCSKLHLKIENNHYYYVENDIFYAKNNSLLWCPEYVSEVIIPSSVTSIEDFAFNYCETLECINIPPTVTSIGKNAFNRCSNLHLKVENNPYYYVKDDILYSKKTNTLLWCPRYIKKVIIPSTVTRVGDRAFDDCEALTSITIPSSITSIGDSAFSSCKSLESITIPSSVISIGKCAFLFCKALKSILIPKGSTEKFKKILPEYLHRYLKEIVAEENDI